MVKMSKMVKDNVIKSNKRKIQRKGVTLKMGKGVPAE